MARRLIQTISRNGRVAKIYRDAEWNEYRTVFYVQGVKQKDADHHTDDKIDAVMTASHWTMSQQGVPA